MMLTEEKGTVCKVAFGTVKPSFFNRLFLRYWAGSVPLRNPGLPRAQWSTVSTGSQ